MRGIVYGVGVGPGDPELMTLKAIRLIRENDVIAVPGKVAKEAVAYQIAAAVVPELADKELVSVYMPMIKDRALIDAEHRKGAKLLEQYLDQGKNVVYITLGDPTVYCTFSYLQHILEADGYQVELVPGIPSFCAAAARLGLPLVEWDEPLHVVPAVHKTGDELDQPGTYVLMKSASHMAEVKDLLRSSGRDVQAVENCSMETEKVYRSVEEIPDDAGYFSLIIAKEHHD
ncbi:MAG: precorrin-2 C(20)-methyltransferase [Oscillospiraceae bacterium]|nr:precorrin-2 C(20)-methyltransferase [Oscillospiraceae bacterium]